jgi:hypothetical protein
LSSKLPEYRNKPVAMKNQPASGGNEKINGQEAALIHFKNNSGE